MRFEDITHNAHTPQTKFPRPARNTATPSSFPESRKRRAAIAVSDVASSKRHHAPRKQKNRQQRLERPLSPLPPDDICYAASQSDGHTLVGTDSPELTELDVKSLTLGVGQESLHSSDAPCLVSDVDSEPFSGVFSSEHAEAESDMPLYSVSSLVDLVPSVSTPHLSASSSMSSTVSSSSCEEGLTEPQTRVLPLTSQGRQAHYLWLDEIIGPPSGIQECVGTYK